MSSVVCISVIAQAISLYIQSRIPMQPFLFVPEEGWFGQPRNFTPPPPPQKKKKKKKKTEKTLYRSLLLQYIFPRLSRLVITCIVIEVTGLQFRE